MTFEDVKDFLWDKMEVDYDKYMKLPWLRYLVETDEKNVNLERVSSVADINGLETLCYVMKTLELLNEVAHKLTSMELYYVRETLLWSEVSKGGTKEQRQKWTEKGYPLFIHNVASAFIYEEHCSCNRNDAYVIRTLIRTHGAAGQVLRGEVPYSMNYPLYELVLNGKISSMESLYLILYVLNYCIVGAISKELWGSTELSWDYKVPDIKGNHLNPDSSCGILSNIAHGHVSDLPVLERLSMLLPVFETEKMKKFSDIWSIFENDRELWYVYAALHDFSFYEALSIFRMVNKYLESCEEDIRHITFQNMASFLYYDYEGKKKINVYKKRIIEVLLKSGRYNCQHAFFVFNVENGVLSVSFELVAACEKLVDFCVVAERSGIFDYEKSIALIFDIFNFRRDGFDRLNNEEKYLHAMNSADNSTKKDILTYITGDVIVDVGSGGGVMIDMIAKDFPYKKVIGTDISRNVIEGFQKRKDPNGRPYDIRNHNFVDGPIVDVAPDTIVFSSILHEIFSYTCYQGSRFNPQSVKEAIKNAVLSLPSNGRIIIRDGVKTNSNEDVCIYFHNAEDVKKLEMFLRDFKGLPEIEKKYKHGLLKEYAILNINLAREFLFTYTWGNESYSHEVQEQFGFFTLEEMLNLLTGLRILKAEEYLEAGYREHLSSLVTLYDCNNREIEIPNSTMFIVLEKP